MKPEPAGRVERGAEWFGFQVSGRKSLESTLRQLEREKALLQHKSQESHRKAENEADRKRCLENEGEVTEVRKRRAMKYVAEICAMKYVCETARRSVAR